MDIVSNSRFTEEEYTFWKEGRKSVKAPTLTESQCAARRARMAKIVQGHKVMVRALVTRVCWRCVLIAKVDLEPMPLMTEIYKSSLKRNVHYFCRAVPLDRMPLVWKHWSPPGAMVMKKMHVVIQHDGFPRCTSRRCKLFSV